MGKVEGNWDKERGDFGVGDLKFLKCLVKRYQGPPRFEEMEEDERVQREDRLCMEL